MNEALVQEIMREIKPGGGAMYRRTNKYDRYWRKCLRRQAVRIIKLINSEGATDVLEGRTEYR